MNDIFFKMLNKPQLCGKFRLFTFPYLPKRFFRSAALVFEDRPLTHMLREELLVLLTTPDEDVPKTYSATVR